MVLVFNIYILTKYRWNYVYRRVFLYANIFNIINMFLYKYSTRIYGVPKVILGYTLPKVLVPQIWVASLSLIAIYSLFSISLIKNKFLFEGDYASFPSGHTITIWGTIWILSFIIKSKAIKIPLFILGILVGMSRIYLVRHWTTDVVASVILSYFIAKFVHKKMFENKERIRKTRLFSYDRKTNIGKKDIIANTLNYKNKKIKI